MGPNRGRRESWTQIGILARLLRIEGAITGWTHRHPLPPDEEVARWTLDQRPALEALYAGLQRAVHTYALEKSRRPDRPRRVTHDRRDRAGRTAEDWAKLNGQRIRLVLDGWPAAHDRLAHSQRTKTCNRTSASMRINNRHTVVAAGTRSVNPSRCHTVRSWNRTQSQTAANVHARPAPHTPPGC